MSDNTESPGSPSDEGKPTPKTPPSTPQGQHTITVIKSSEAEDLKTRETVVSENEISVSVNGMDVEVTTSASGGDEPETGSLKPEEMIEPDAGSSAGSVQEKEEGAAAMEDNEDSGEEEDIVDWTPRPLSDEDVNSILENYPDIPPYDMKKYLDFFWSIDQKRYGFMTVQDFSRELKRKRGYLTNEQITKIFSELDGNCDFIVDLDEFLDQMSRKQVYDISKADIQPVFDDIDHDKDGVISQSDLERWCSNNLAVEGKIDDPFLAALQRNVQVGHKIDIDYFFKIVRRCWPSSSRY